MPHLPLHIITPKVCKDSRASTIQPPQPVLKLESTPISKAPAQEMKRPPSTSHTETKKRPSSTPKVETKPPPSIHNIEMKRPPSTLKATPTPAQQRPNPSPAASVPRVVIPTSSPDVQKQLQNQQQKRPSLQGIEKAAAKPAKPPVDYQVLLLPWPMSI
jgi:hypothetical protein